MTDPLISPGSVGVRGTKLLPGDTGERYRERLARIALDSMTQFVALLDVEGNVLEINQVALDGAGIRLADVEGKPFWTTFWWQVSGAINAQLREMIGRAALGEAVRWDAEILVRPGGTETIVIDASLRPVTDEQGQIVFITAEGRDITEKTTRDREIARLREKLAKRDELEARSHADGNHELRTSAVRAEALRDEARRLRVLNRTAATLAAEIELERLVQSATDAATELTGAQFGAFFYNVVDNGGESYLLYTISGVPKEMFSNFPRPRNTAVFGPTFAGEGIVRSGDIRQDARYGRNEPYKGIPKGHLPVVSYLAVPVIAPTGEVLGGLFFGHPEPDRFTEHHELVVAGIAAQAAAAFEKARLYEASRKAEGELRRLNETLEQRVALEVAERMKAEEALRQAQKMEAIGHLTGGVAHDFNNLLQVVVGNLEGLKRRLAKPEMPTRGDLARLVDGAMEGAQRGAALTHRLLAFSRRQPLVPRPLDMNSLVSGMSELLRSTLGEKVVVRTVYDNGLWRVSADANQLENAILNLAVNARDAMVDGGRLTIESANVHLDKAFIGEEARPGDYAMLSVADTGIGMTREVAASAFDPFFTTKEVGRGTGLGLSQVYGFVKQSGGIVRICSAPGQGTTVSIYLPRLSDGT